MSSEVPASDTDISDHTNKPTSRDQDSIHMPPNLLQLEEERFIILDMAELVRAIVVALQVPIGR